METRLKEIAERIRGMREIVELTPQQMAERLNVPLDQYLRREAGEEDFSFTFLLGCAQIFGIDMVELLTGERPKLSFYTVVRKGKGLPIKRRKNLNYEHLAFRLQDKQAEPFLVTAPYLEEEQDAPIHLSRHKGQEFDYILSGKLKMQLEDHVEILEEGDAIYYNSRFGHGMIAVGGEPCTFIAVVIKDEEEDEDDEQE